MAWLFIHLIGVEQNIQISQWIKLKVVFHVPSFRIMRIETLWLLSMNTLHFSLKFRINEMLPVLRKSLICNFEEGVFFFLFFLSFIFVFVLLFCWYIYKNFSDFGTMCLLLWTMPYSVTRKSQNHGRNTFYSCYHTVILSYINIHPIIIFSKHFVKLSIFCFRISGWRTFSGQVLCVITILMGMDYQMEQN